MLKTNQIKKKEMKSQLLSVKNLLIFPILMLCTFVNAQTKSIELYDLIKMFVPDSAKASAIGDWKTGSNAGSPINWTSTSPRKTPIGYIKEGNVNISLAGQKPEKSSISIDGKTLTGYAEINISTTPPMEKEDYSYKLENLLNKKSAKINLIKEDGFGNPMYYYQLNLPGKKPMWVILMIDSGGGSASSEGSTPTLMIICLFDKKEFDQRIN